MSDKKLTILAIIAVIMVALNVIQAYVAKKPEVVATERTYLIQGLDPDKIAKITIESDNQKVQLERKGAIFVVTDKDNYPAKSERINELITKLMDIKTTELITSDPTNYEDLGISDEKAQHIVKFLDNQGQLITGVVIGKTAEQGGSYVKLVNSNDVYLASNIPWIRRSPLDYTEQQLISIKRDDIESVTVTDANNLSYTLQQEPNSTEIKLVDHNIPEGKKFGYEHKSVFFALTSLRFDDVFSEANAPNDLKFNQSYICRLKDSRVYTLKLAKSGDKTYAKCSAEFTGKKEVVIDPSKKDSEEELKKKEAKLLAIESIEKFNRKCKGWVYQIPSWKAKNLTRPLEELFEEKEKPVKQDSKTSEKQKNNENK